ncbi:uncharacterized protein LOC135836028 [Planococcus citri]|uniref:uncharacterized protein LOC135836028 n=1 Tax=Planococcus citri TaxID=170843 RepID=UPI0031F7D58E
MWETICQFSLLVPLVAYFSIRYYYNYWQRKKIPCVESNVLNFDWFTLPTIEYTAKIYRLLDGHKFGGCYPKFAPKLMLRDPELIKRVLNDDSECFCDRSDVTFDENVPKTMHMFGAPSIFWKNLHENLAPLFTSDRMEFLFDLIGKCSKEMNETISNEIKMDEVIDTKDFSDRYAVEVISSCIFGLKTHDTIRNGKFLFKSIPSKTFHHSWMTKLSILIYSIFPKLGKIFGIFSTNESAYELIFETFEETVTYREKNSVDRNDFLQLLIDLRNEKGNPEMTNEILAAQCYSFLVTGYKSMSMTLSAALFELAANPRVQERLQVEIDSYFEKVDGKVTYEMVENMPYLHRVFSETLRKYPVLGALSRVCVVDYQIPGTEVIIEKGTEILIPVSGLHCDAQYFPNPEVFDPDRFEDLSKLPCCDAYFPFGDGPKNCIGSRFALIVIQLALIYLLRAFRFEVCSKTRHPIEFQCNEIFTSAEHEIFLKCLRNIDFKMWETAVQFLVLAPLIIYFGFDYYYNYWKRKHIPYVPSNILDLDWYNLPQGEYFTKIYHRLKGHKFGGFYARFAPKLMIRDPELIKHILIKDFDYFHDRGDTVFDENEPITTHMFSAPGPLWKKLRTKLTPTFTSGKMKYMFSLVEECAKEMSEVINKRIEDNSTIDVKEFSIRYTIEVISSCAFGLKANTIQDGNSIFKLMALKIFARNLSARFVVLTRSALPWLKKALRISQVNKTVTEFFYKLTRDTVDHRKSNAVDRNDFLQLLINMRDDEKQKDIKQAQDKFVMTDELMTAQCFLFFVAGFDTSSSALSGALYELAANLSIQRKLQDEIDEYLRKNDDKISYEMVKSMPYLNQIVSETLRKYPVLVALNRVCVQRYRIPDTKIYIEKGTEVLIPVIGLHSDPQYYPDPEQFDPDRFKDPNNFSSRNAYLPFGDGPRNCIGSRFAQMSVKLALVYLLRDFNFEWCPATRSPLQFERFKIVNSVKHEIFLKCSKK